MFLNKNPEASPRLILASEISLNLATRNLAGSRGRQANSASRRNSTTCENNNSQRETRFRLFRASSTQIFTVCATETYYQRTYKEAIIHYFFKRAISFSIASSTSVFFISSSMLKTTKTLPPYLASKSRKLAFILSVAE